MGEIEGGVPPAEEEQPDRGPGVNAAARSRDRRRGNLPADVNSFVGRDRDEQEVSALLNDARLVTITGAPGIGKSRLALRVARAYATSCEHGAWLVELAAVLEPGRVPAAVAAALSVAEESGAPLEETIAERLRSLNLLLVLDNCEHLTAACARLTAALLGACPAVRVLVTSRERLAIDAERIWQLEPLSAPPPSVTTAGLDSLLRYDAVKLFVGRAAASQPAFALNLEDAPAVAEICRRLDGLPLAIELAAARLQMLTAHEIASRLDDSFALLTGGSRSDLPRHQTLHAAIGWSYELLAPAERRLLLRLAVFVGGFSVDAAEQVCAAGEVAQQDVSHLLEELASRSLVMPANGDGRYLMLETVRAFAEEGLRRSPDAGACLEAHARFYLGFAERAEREFEAPDQVRWFDLVEVEYENLREAAARSLVNGQAEWGLRIAGSLALFWRVRGRFTDGRTALEEVLAAADGVAAPVTAKALWARAFMTLMTGDVEEASATAAQILPWFRRTGDIRGCARAMLIIGNDSVEPQWREALEESARLAEEAGDDWCQALALFSLGHTSAVVSDLPAARPPLERCLEVARRSGQRYILNYGLIGLGDVALVEGNYDAAGELLGEAVAGARELGDEYTEATALLHLGELALRRGDPREARRLLEDALMLFDRSRSWSTCEALLLLGEVAVAEGDVDRAQADFERILDGAVGDAGRASVLLHLGRLALEDGDPDHARRLLEEALERLRREACWVPHRAALAATIHALADVARRVGDLKRAAALHNEALALRREIGEAPGIVASIEAIGGLAATRGTLERAAQLLGAGQALRAERRYARSPLEATRYDADVAITAAALSPEQFASAIDQGAALSIGDAAKLASRGGRRGRPPSGWSSLTEREHTAALLVAEGLTNPEIADRLGVSLDTVKHLIARAFPKLGVESRREMAREVKLRQAPAVDDAPPG